MTEVPACSISHVKFGATRWVGACLFFALSTAAVAQEGVRSAPPVAQDRHKELSHVPVRSPRTQLSPAQPDVARRELWRDLSANQRRAAMENLAPAESSARPAEGVGRRMSPDERRALRQQIREAHQELAPARTGSAR